MKARSWLGALSALFMLVVPARAEPLAGRFVSEDGLALALSPTADGAFAARLGDRTGRAVREGDRLVLTWATPPARGGMAQALLGSAAAKRAARAGEPAPRALAIAAIDGRLALVGEQRTLLREEAAAWWRLPGHLRRALTGPLGGLAAESDASFVAFFADRYAGTPVAPEDARAEWAFERLDEGARIALLSVQAKMARDGVWQVVGPLAHVSRQGALHFEPTIDQEALQAFLAGRAFGDWWWASRGVPWGMRSRFRGVQLHWKGGHPTQVHIDFRSPGDPLDGRVTSPLEELPVALDHFAVDFLGWHLNHEPERLLREVRGAGIEVVIP